VAGALSYGCVSRIAEMPAVEGVRPADFPEEEYRRAVASGRPVFRIDPASSFVTIEVRRAGSLARLGHDHVDASHDVQGYVLPDAGRADLSVALDALVVDEPALRAEAGFDTQPTPDAIAGTRRNMLERTLETQRFPFASIGVRSIALGRGEHAATASVSISLHGATRDFEVPLHVTVTGDTTDVSGRMTLTQSAFGIVPLSIVGGAIQVQDAVAVHFVVRARRIDAG
jgi:hypothetical protein